MARSKSITETGPKALRGIRNLDLYGNNSILSPERQQEINDFYRRSSKAAYYGFKGASTYNPFVSDELYTPQIKPELNEWGQSSFDNMALMNPTAQDITDIRAENQPWYSKIINGTLKGVITAGTTFVNGTLGLVVGLGQGIVNLADDNPNTGFLSGLWDNSVTNITQKISDWQEKALPNYYSTEEQTSPWYENIFTANFLGDKFIKNLGFTVGAFYGGGIYAKALEAVKWMPGMARAGIASGLSAINEGSIEALNNSRDWYNMKLSELREQDDAYLQDVKANLVTKAAQLKAEYEASAGNFVKSVDGGYVDPAFQKYQQGIAALEQEYKTAESQVAKNRELQLAKLNEDRAKMGNADLLMNIPILTASNMFQFGKYLAGGAKTSVRTSKVFNTTGAGIADNLGKAEMYAVKSSKLTPWANGLGRGLSEGAEELTQKMASEISGDYYGKDVINYYKHLKDPDAEEETVSWINSFGEGIAKTVGDSSSWEEFSIGFITGILGVPVFGKSFTQNAYIGKGKAVGIAGGMAEAFADYRSQQKQDQELADAMNQRVQSPEFLNYYQGMIRHRKEQTEMDKAIDAGNIREYKDHEHNQLVSDITLWSNAGKIDEIKEYIKAESELSDENVDDIIKQTTSKVSENPAFSTQINKLQSNISKLQRELDEAMEDPEKHRRKIANRQKSIAESEKKLQELIDKRDDILGPFVDDKGNVKDRDAIKEQLKSRADDINRTIDRYLEIKEEIDSSTNAVLSRDQLSHLTWLKSHIENWDDRNKKMSGELKQNVIPAIIESLREETDYFNGQIEKLNKSKKKNKAEAIKEAEESRDFSVKIIDSLEKMLALDDDRFGRGLAIMPQIATMLKLAMTKPDVAQKIGQVEAVEYMQKVDDILANTQAAMQYGIKLREYLSKPGLLEDEMKAADEEAAKEYIRRETQKVKKDIKDKVNTVAEFRDAVYNLPNSDAIVDELANDDDEKISNLAKEYKSLSGLAKIGVEHLSQPSADEKIRLAREGALLSFNKIMEESNSLDEAIKKIEDEIKIAKQNVESKSDNWELEEKVAEALDDLLEKYNTSKNNKVKQESDKNVAERSSKKKSKRIDDDEDDGVAPSKPRSENKEEEEEEKEEITIDDVIFAYRKLGKKISPAYEKALKDKADEEGNLDFLDGDLAEVYESLLDGTFEAEDDEEGEEEKTDKIDFDELNSMNPKEALAYLKRLDLDELDRTTSKKVRKLIARITKDLQSVNGIKSGDSASSSSENNKNISNDPAFRSWGKYAKYMFEALSDRSRREAILNTEEDAEDYIKALDELGAFEFVENGSLGRIYKQNPNVSIRYIKVAGKKDSPNIALEDSILLAIELTPAITRIATPINAIDATDSDGNIKTYQVVGVLGFNESDAVEKNSYRALSKALQKEQGKQRPNYWVSSKYSNKIREIKTGRMVKSGTITDSKGTVSDEFNPNRSLKEVLHGVKPIIGVYYSDAEGIRIPGLPMGAVAKPLNKANDNNRAGSVWLMVQEADGNFYPKALSVRRFTAEEYNLEEHKDSPILKEIVDMLKIICNPDESDIDRYEAKYYLQQSLLYFEDDINILYNDDVISIVGEDSSTTFNNIGAGLSVDEKVDKILNILQLDEFNIRFQIVTSSLSDSDYVNELLDSDILVTDLLRAQNVNASFNLYIHNVEDDELGLIEGDTESVKSDSKRSGEINTDLNGTTTIVGRKQYTLRSDGVVLYKNSEVADKDIIAQVKLANSIQNGTVNPIGGNVYIGTVDGVELGLKRLPGGGFKVLKKSEIESAKAKEEKKKEAERKRKAREELDKKKIKRKVKDNSEDNSEDSDAELKSKARKGLFKENKKDNNEEEITEPNNEDYLLEDNVNKWLQSDVVIRILKDYAKEVTSVDELIDIAISENEALFVQRALQKAREYDSSRNILQTIIDEVNGKSEVSDTPSPVGPPIIGQSFKPINLSSTVVQYKSLNDAAQKNEMLILSMTDRDTKQQRFSSIDEFLSYVKSKPDLLEKSKTATSADGFNKFLNYINHCG